MMLQPLTILLALSATSYVSGELDLLKFPLLNNIQNINNQFNAEESFGIINGTKTDILHHPYQAGIWLKTGNGQSFFLSGTIVDKKWILTLALLPIYAKELIVSVGQSKLSKVQEFIEVEKIVLNPGYCGGTDHHASLIKLKRPVKFSKTVQSIAISSSSPKSGSKAVLSGWGLTQVRNFTRSDDLLETELSVLTTKECKPKYLASFVSETVNCGYKKGVRPLYDNGGPLVENKKLTGIFITDLTSPVICKTYPKCPSIFTDVTLMRSWIKETIKNE